MDILAFSLYLMITVIQDALAEVPAACITPTGEHKTCVPIIQCPDIYAAVLANNESAIASVQPLYCGDGDEMPLLCCGSYGQDNVHDTSKTTDMQFNSETQFVLEDLPTKELPDRSICGIETTAGLRIFGGNVSALGESPWMAALEVSQRSSGVYVGIYCGGTIINENFVLTAAHCITHEDLVVSAVRLGEHDTKKDPDCEQAHCADSVKIYGVSKFIAHPFSGASKDNDIGLIKLNATITFSDFIRPICLPPENLPLLHNGMLLKVSGWGFSEHGSLSDVKLQVEVPFVSNTECSKAIKIVPVHINQMCAGGKHGQDACRGDSGGPLVRAYRDKLGQEQWFIEGIVSWGIGCGVVGKPAIYTRASRYTNWIILNIENN